MRKLLKQIAIAAALIVAATIGISSPAAAVDYGTYKNRRNTVCLDSNSNGSVYTLGCNSGTNQDWDLQFISGTSYYLKNRATGRCLDANASNAVYAPACNGGTNQRWRRVYPSGGSWGQWINIQTGKCLTASNLLGLRAVTTSVCTSDQVRLWARI